MTVEVLQNDLARAHQQLLELQDSNERLADANAYLQLKNDQLEQELKERIEWEKSLQAHLSESSSKEKTGPTLKTLPHTPQSQ